MDMIAVDLTGITAAGVGERVVLWGDFPRVDAVAANAETISYELLCGLSERTRHQLVND